VPFTTIGSGSNTVGYWLGDLATNRLVVAPKSTEVTGAWGSPTILRGTTSTTNGVANTTTLHSFGSAAHPAAYYCKTLATGGYNTWYLPAKDELITMYSNKAKTPFATANAFAGGYQWSSTEVMSNTVWVINMTDGTTFANGKYNKNTIYNFRATRRSTI
jgi:hypothetical protein